MSTKKFQSEIKEAYRLEDENFFSGASHTEKAIIDKYLSALNELSVVFQDQEETVPPDDVDMQELADALCSFNRLSEARRARRLRYGIKMKFG